MAEPCVAEEAGGVVIPEPMVGECIAMRFTAIGTPEMRKGVLASWGLEGVAEGRVYGLRCSKVINHGDEEGADFVFVPLDDQTM